MAENTTYTVVSKSNDEDSQLDMFWRISIPSTPAITATDYLELKVGSKPRYVVVENFTDQTKFEWYEGLTTTVSAGSFVVGTLYTILSVGSTDFTLVGAPNNVIGSQFYATGVGAGSGTATTNDNVCLKTTQLGARTVVTSNSILVRDRVVQLSQNVTTAIIAVSKDLAIRASA